MILIDACLLVLNQYVTVECNQSIFMIKTRIDTFLSCIEVVSENVKIG